MRRIVKLGSYAALSLLMTTGLTGCGGILERDAPPTEDEIVLGQDGRTMWESNLQYVKIVNRDTSGRNDHPESLTSEQVKTLLQSLYVSERLLVSRVENPVFSVGELQILSAAVANGLSQAETNEDVNFVTIGVHKASVSKERKTNSGRIFMQNGRLNIVFGLMHQTYQDVDPFTKQKIDRRTNPLLPGTRRTEASFDGNLVLDKGQSFYIDPETGKERRDWIILDIPTVLATAAERKDNTEGRVSPELIEDVARSKKRNWQLA
jgi:hypothetical protein